MELSLQSLHSSKLRQFLTWPYIVNVLRIPHICHFFYTDRIFENQILHPKTKITKNTKNVSEKVKYMHFFTQSGKIYT